MQARQATPARFTPDTTADFLLSEFRVLLTEARELPARSLSIHDRISRTAGFKKVLHALFKNNEVDLETYLDYLQGAAVGFWE